VANATGLILTRGVNVMLCKLTKITALASIAMFLVGITACAQSAAPEESSVIDAQGAIHFESHEEFFATIDAVGRMTPAELDSWEARRGFVSYRHEFARVMQQVVNAPTPQEADALLLANEDIVELTDDRAEPRIRAFGYSAIVNRSGIFYVEDVIHKVTPDVVISAEDGRLETIDATLASLGEHGTALRESMTTPAEGVRVVRYRGERQERQEQQLVQIGCTDVQTANYRNSDREVDLKIQTSIYTCGGCCGNYYNQVKVEGGMWAFKKNFWGNWVDYGTTYNYEQLEFQITAPQVVGYSVGPNGQLVSEFNYQPYTLSSLSGASSGGDWVNWSMGTWYVGHQVQNSPINVPYFDKAKGRGKSRGTGENGWAQFCCGYAGGCNFEPACVPRTSCYVGECEYVSDNCGGSLYCGACGGGGGGGCGSEICIEPQ
jgi:hypothetical protein